MLTEADLKAAFSAAYVHLKPGGVLLTYNENDPDYFQQNEVRHSVHQLGGLEITFIENRYDSLPHDGVYELALVYLIRRAGRLQIETDRHMVGMFDNDTWVQILKSLGFKVVIPEKKEDEEITTFICVKPLEEG